MSLPPYTKANRCPACGSDIYVPAEEYEVATVGGRKYRALRPLAVIEEGVPPVMSACGCAWLRRAVAAGAGGVG